jgi:hypothetical protein
MMNMNGMDACQSSEAALLPPKFNLPSILYYDSLEDEDLITNLTCFQACIYYLIKTELNCDDEDICEIFLRDMTFGIEVTPDGLINDFCFPDTTLNEFGFKKNYRLGRGIETFREVTALLDQGKAVVVQIYMQRVPFFKDFKGIDFPLDEEHYKANYHWQHTFLIIGYDHENLYYVEGPYNLNKERYIPYPGNPTIGIIKIDQLFPAFDAYLNYTYLDFDIERMADMFQVLQMVTAKSVAGYNLASHKTDKFNYYYGKEALDKLFTNLCSDSLDIQQPVPKHSITLGDLLIWKTQAISNRRMMLAKVFSKHSSRFAPSEINPIIDMLKQCTKMWRSVQANIIKMQVKKTNRIGADFHELLADVGRVEDEIIEGLEKLVSQEFVV